MHKGIFRTNHSSTIVYWKVLREPKWQTWVVLAIGIVSTCEETTCEILRLGLKRCSVFGNIYVPRDEIDTCISHRHVKSDIDVVRPTSVDQVIHASLKMCRIF